MTLPTQWKRWGGAALIGLAFSLLGVSAAWTAGYTTGYNRAQHSAYNETLDGLLALARSTSQALFAQKVTEWGANLGRRNDVLMYAVTHPGNSAPEPPPPPDNAYEKALAEQRAKHPAPPRAPVK